MFDFNSPYCQLKYVLIAGESNFDEKNVEEVFNLCSTCVQLVFN